MKIEIGDNNEIKNSNIGENNSINTNSENDKLWKMIIEIIIGIIATVVGGYILFKFKWN